MSEKTTNKNSENDHSAVPDPLRKGTMFRRSLCRVFYDARPIASLLDKPSSCLPAIWQPKKYYDPRKSV